MVNKIQYKYCENKNFEDFASGRVLLSKPGTTNFPVRLAQEIYCRCLNYLNDAENICLYDPCGGNGYLLTTLGLLNYNSLKLIICSDIDNQSLEIAKQNLNLLSNLGLDNRINQLESLYKRFDKSSHIEALESAKRLKYSLDKHTHKPDTLIFLANILKHGVLEKMTFKADIVFSDVPYGNLVSWQGNDKDAINILLNNLIPVLKPYSVVAICSDKRQKINHNQYKRLEKGQVGKRKFELLSLK